MIETDEIISARRRVAIVKLVLYVLSLVFVGVGVGSSFNQSSLALMVIGVLIWIDIFSERFRRKP